MVWFWNVVSVAAWRPPRPPIARIAQVGQTRRSASGARDCDGLCGLHAIPPALPGLNGPWAAQCQGTRVTTGVIAIAGRPMTAGRVSASGTCEHPFMRITWGHPQWPGSGCIVLRGSLHIDILSRIMCWAPANLWQGMGGDVEVVLWMVQVIAGFWKRYVWSVCGP